MGILDRLFGQQPSRDTAGLSDEQALQRYRYLVRTAPPEAVEEAHREAFARLTSEQRQQVLRELNGAVPPAERIDDPNRADPQTLARMATRAELRQPGLLERTLGGRSMGGPGLGGMFATSLLGSVVGSFLGSAIAHQFLGGFAETPAAAAGDELATGDDNSADDADLGDSAGDSGDFGGDAGAGFGDDI